MINKKKIRWLFALVILIFIVEFVMKIGFEEPYPAITYPSFGDIPNVSRPIKKPTIKVFYSNNDSSEINSADLFYHLPISISSVILRENFTQKKSFLTTAKTKKEFTLKMGLNRSEIKIYTPQNEKKRQNGITWIQKRLTKILQRTDFNRLEVQWYNLFDSANNAVQNKLMEIFVVDLK